jgi:hypothetical protein
MSGGGGSQKVTNETKATPWAGVQPYLANMYAAAGSQMGTPMGFYPYNTYAPQSPLTGAGQGAALDFANNAMPGYLETGNNALASLFQSADVASNPYVNGMLEAQARGVGDQLTRQWLPAVRQGASLAGQTGSTRQGVAEGVAIGEAAKALTNAAAQTQLSAYDRGLSAQAQAAAMLPMMSQLGMMPAQTMQQVGSQQEAYLQKQIDEAVNRFNFYQEEPWKRLNYANAIYSGVPWSSSSTQTSNAGSGSTAANVLGGGLTGYSLGSALGSSAFGTGISTALGLPAYMGLGIPGAILGAGLGLLGR